MNRKLSLLCSVAVITAWASPSFATPQAIPSSGTTLDATGVAGGAALTGSTTLTVPNGFNVYTNNSNSGVVIDSTLPAITDTIGTEGAVVFSGNSTVFGTIGTSTTLSLASISAGVAGDAVNFMGNVYSTSLQVSGTGSVNFDSGSTNVTAMEFDSDGTISIGTNTAVDGAITTLTDNTGTLVLYSGSSLIGAVGGPATTFGLKNITVAGGSNTAGVTATISGAVNAYAFTLGTNTLDVVGALTVSDLNTSGVINTTLASSSVYGNINVTGGTTNLGAALAVHVTVPTTAYFPVGTVFNVVKSQSGAGTSVVTVTVENPTNPLYTFAAVPLAGTTNGLVDIITTGIPLQVATTPDNPLTSPAATALLNVPNPSADLTVVLAAINAFSDQASVINATAQLAPSTPDLAAPLVTFQGAREFQDLWLARMNDSMCGDVSQLDDKGTSTCKKQDPQAGWWAKGFGQFSSQETRGAYSGYNSQIVGTMVAYDKPISNTLNSETRVGAGVGYERTTINATGFDNNTDSNTYQAMAYVGHEQGLWYINGDLSLGWNEYSSTRHIAFSSINRTAKGDFSGQDYTGFVTTGYHFPVYGFALTPLASLQYTHMDLDSYTESGAGDINLKVDSQSYDFLESGLGGKASHSFAAKSGTYIPEVHAKWLHELNNPSLSNTTTFTSVGASSFSTPGLTTNDDTYNVGTGLTLLSCSCSAETWSVEAVYDHDWRADGYTADQGMVKFSSRF